MAPWKVVARSFRPAPRIPGIASDAPPPPRSRDTHSREDLGSPAPAHRAPGAGGDHIRGTQTPCEQACAAPTVSASSPLRPVRADTPGTPATTKSQSILCASTAECTQKSHLIISLNHRYLKVFPNSCGEPFFDGVLRSLEGGAAVCVCPSA